MSEVQVQDVELDTDGVEESSVDVEQPSATEESTATPEVDLGYTDPVNNDKAEIIEEPKSEDNLQVGDIAPFEVGDLVQVGINATTATRIEVMEITSITDDSGTDDDAAGTLVVNRALYGTSKADKDSQTNGTNGAVSGANVHFPIFNGYYDYSTDISGSSQLNPLLVAS